MYYAAQIVRVANHQEPPAHLWEAGHILWRPLGYAAAPLALKIVPDRLAWTPELKIYSGLALFNVACGLVSALLIFDMGRRLSGGMVAAAIVVLLFVWGDSVLSYTDAATSYIAGLAALNAGLWCQIAPRALGKLEAAGAGILFAIAALFWLPYAIVLPAACCAAFLLRPGLKSRERAQGTVLSALVAGMLLLAAVLSAAALAGVHSVPDGVRWFSASGHGIRQQRQLIRAITGCSRLFFELGRDGVYFKRFLFHDPYHVVTLTALIGYSLWKVLLFYIFLASVFWMAWRSPRGRQALVLLSMAAVPALLTAVILFEPSAPERFLPVLPFLLLSIAAAWSGALGSPSGRAAVIAVSAFALLLPLANLRAFVSPDSGYHAQAAAQLAALRANASSSDAVFIVTMAEPLEDLSLHPFDPLNRYNPVSPHWLIDGMRADLPQWRSRFGRSVESDWEQGRAVWVEKAALADTPPDSLYWTEGDNQTVLWRDIPAFFRTLEFDRDTGGANGFLRLTRSPANQARFRALESVVRCASSTNLRAGACCSTSAFSAYARTVASR